MSLVLSALRTDNQKGSCQVTQTPPLTVIVIEVGGVLHVQYWEGEKKNKPCCCVMQAMEYRFLQVFWNTAVGKFHLLSSFSHPTACLWYKVTPFCKSVNQTTKCSPAF